VSQAFASNETMFDEEKHIIRKYTSSSSIKIAEDGSLFDIFSWPSLKPGSISAFKVKGKTHIHTNPGIFFCGCTNPGMNNHLFQVPLL